MLQTSIKAVHDMQALAAKFIGAQTCSMLVKCCIMHANYKYMQSLQLSSTTAIYALVII